MLALALFEPTSGQKAVLIRQMVGAPARLVIHPIGVDAEIEQIHIRDGVMAVPDDPWHVGWYSQLGFPGDGGNVVMAGHKDWWDIGPVVFWDLGLLQPGDTIVVLSHGGDELRYAVESVDQLSSMTPPAEYTANTGSELLTLITCSGTFDGAEYDARLIVRARPA